MGEAAERRSISRGAGRRDRVHAPGGGHRDPVRDDARRHPGPWRDRARPCDGRPECGRPRAVHAGSARRGARAVARHRTRRGDRRLHLELHRVRGDRLSHRGRRPPARTRPARPAPARRRRRGARPPRGRRPRSGLAANDGVIFTGRVPHDQIERYYRTIDVFVVPRTNDRVSQLVTPLKPYEAMAMSKALVVSAVGALLEIVERASPG